MSTDTNPVEHPDRWILNLRGRRVAKVALDPHLELSLGSGWDVVLESRAVLSHGSALTNPSIPLTPTSRNIAAQLLGTSVLSAIAFKSGALRMVFDAGLHLNCSDGPAGAAWEITGPQGWCFTSMPGGGLTVSPGRAEAQ
ncbi:DUF6188 family protein [Kitasatospora sp. NPDC057015]|uniref:DUF6188 family protein n=1 Tax=Kitasatospora sp. NPDC057015 TaxID=3346001 RepID=UPI003633CEE0